MKRLMRFFSMFWCIVLIVTTTNICQVDAAEPIIGASGINWDAYDWRGLVFPEEISSKIESIDWQIIKHHNSEYHYYEAKITTKETCDFETVEKIYHYVESLLLLRAQEKQIVIPDLSSTYTWDSYSYIDVDINGNIVQKNSYSYTKNTYNENSSKFPTTIYGNRVTCNYTLDKQLYYYEGKYISIRIEQLCAFPISIYNEIVEIRGEKCASSYTYPTANCTYEQFMQLCKEGIVTVQNIATAKYGMFNHRYFPDYSWGPVPVFTDGKIHTSEEFINY